MEKPSFYLKAKEYAIPNLNKSVTQIVSSLIFYFSTIGLMYFLVKRGVPYIFTFILSILGAGFLIKIFIIFHDCTHGSYFKSRKACEIVGNICGVLSFTSFNDWQHTHAVHHSTVGNLEKRGIGDVWTMTLEEYNNSSNNKKFLYRIFRNPVFLFLIAPFFLFLILNRFPSVAFRKKDIKSLLITDISLILIFLLCYFTIGVKFYLLIQIPILYFASLGGVYLFYVQHQFEDVYWEHNKNYDRYTAAFKGSSFFKLPKLLNYFSGNIGYHHIHHLNPSIPNYNLKNCYNNVLEFQEVKPVTLIEAFKTISLKLYDEKSKKLIGFR